MSRTSPKKTAPAVPRRIITAEEWRRLHLPGAPSRIMSDPELRAYVDELMPKTSFKRIAEACREKFGRKRAPGKSAVHRYWQSIVRPGLIDPKTGLPLK